MPAGYLYNDPIYRTWSLRGHTPHTLTEKGLSMTTRRHLKLVCHEKQALTFTLYLFIRVEKEKHLRDLKRKMCYFISTTNRDRERENTAVLCKGESVLEDEECANGLERSR